MHHRIAAAACLLAGCLCIASVHAGPPDGKGPPHHRSAEHGHPGKGKPGRDHHHHHRDHRHRDHHHRDHHHRDHHHRDDRYSDRDVLRALVDAGISAVVARDYARQSGLRGYGDLPPGIRKNLMRGKPLPPGIARKVRSGAFRDRLPRHSGYEWQMAGTDLILVSVATDVIADILLDVFD